MARVTVEDCLDKIPNRFDLVVLAARRARDITLGRAPFVERENDKPTVIALREIAEGLIDLDYLSVQEASPMDILGKPDPESDPTDTDEAIAALLMEAGGRGTRKKPVILMTAMEAKAKGISGRPSGNVRRVFGKVCRSRPMTRVVRHGHLLKLGQEENNLYPSLHWARAVRAGSRRKPANCCWWQDWNQRRQFQRRSSDAKDMASSQIVCVNFLLPLIEIPGALTAVLKAVDDDVTGIVEIDHQDNRAPVEFEWIGLEHALEGPGVTSRGTNSTSVDAFLIADTPSGRRAYLMEWKYVEEYSTEDKGKGSGGETRRSRYKHFYEDSPAFNGVAPFDAWLFDPFYQIMRLRLLADRMVQRQELEVSEAKVVAVVPEGNRAYRRRITSPWFAKEFPNRSVSDIVRETLVDPDSAYASVSQSALATAVRKQCGEAAMPWGTYQRERYGW